LRPPLSLVEQLQGVDSLRVIGVGQVSIFSERGIGRVHIELPAAESLELFLYYSRDQPFPDPEGLLLSRSDGSEVEKGGAWDHVDNSVHLLPQKEATRWQLLFIDYYR
jgi:hypothetical protein